MWEIRGFEGFFVKWKVTLWDGNWAFTKDQDQYPFLNPGELFSLSTANFLWSKWIFLSKFKTNVFAESYFFDLGHIFHFSTPHFLSKIKISLDLFFKVFGHTFLLSRVPTFKIFKNLNPSLLPIKISSQSKSRSGTLFTDQTQGGNTPTPKRSRYSFKIKIKKNLNLKNLNPSFLLKNPLKHSPLHSTP